MNAKKKNCIKFFLYENYAISSVNLILYIIYFVIYFIILYFLSWSSFFFMSAYQSCNIFCFFDFFPFVQNKLEAFCTYHYYVNLLALFILQETFDDTLDTCYKFNHFTPWTVTVVWFDVDLTLAELSPFHDSFKPQTICI